MGLRGAFQKTRGLNHFQPVMVFSFKHRFFTYPLLHFINIKFNQLVFDNCPAQAAQRLCTSLFSLRCSQQRKSSALRVSFILVEALQSIRRAKEAYAFLV
jgi:hypothetical protein